MKLLSVTSSLHYRGKLFQVDVSGMRGKKKTGFTFFCDSETHMEIALELQRKSLKRFSRWRFRPLYRLPGWTFYNRRSVTL